VNPEPISRDIWQHAEAFLIVTTVCVFGRGAAAGFWGLEARDAANHPTMHMTAPYKKNYLDPNVSAEAEKS